VTYSFTTLNFFNTLVGQGVAFNPRGAAIGGQIGYLMQNNWFVYGFEFSGDWTNLNQTVTGPVPAFPFDAYTNKITDMETLTARLGIAPGAGNWLFYIKLGAATVNRQFATFGDSIHQIATCTVVASCGAAGVQTINLRATSNSDNVLVQTLLGRLSYKF
jgi:hypothetical protein